MLPQFQSNASDKKAAIKPLLSAYKEGGGQQGLQTRLPTAAQSALQCLAEEGEHRKG